MNERELLKRLMDDPEHFDGKYDEDFNQKAPRKMRDGRDKSFKPRRQKPSHKQRDDGED